MNVKVRKKKGKDWLEVYLWLRLPNGEKYEEKRKSPVESKSGAQRWGESRLQHIASHWQEFSRVELDNQKHLEPKASVPTVKEFEERFIRDYAEANRQKPSTIEAKKSIMKNHLVPMFADVPLDRITTLQVQQLKGKLADRSPKAVNNVLNTLRVMLGCGVKWGVIERLPCHIELLKSQSPEMQFYDLEEHKRLLEVAAEMENASTSSSSSAAMRACAAERSSPWSGRTSTSSATSSTSAGRSGAGRSASRREASHGGCR